MVEFFVGFSPIIQALFATLFTWGLTALGSAGVFLSKDIHPRMLNAMLGFASGVMIAASFWSLLAPAIAMSEGGVLPSWFPAIIGFLMGGAFLYLVDRLLPHLHFQGLGAPSPEGIKTSWQRSVLLTLAITLHNLPEGLAVGVAFGAAATGLSDATTASAIALAIGIGIQNFPEGLAVSAPLRREGLSRRKSFMLGQASGMVEPLAGMLGAAAVYFIQPMLPYALAFAAGAMIYVCVEELIPTAKTSAHSDIATLGIMLGFSVMMLLDVALG